MFMGIHHIFVKLIPSNNQYHIPKHKLYLEGKWKEDMSSKYNKKSKMHNLDYNPHIQLDPHHNIIALYMPIKRWLGTFNLLWG
jgi:hypothetical protein